MFSQTLHVTSRPHLPDTVELISTLGALSPPRRARPGPGPHTTPHTLNATPCTSCSDPTVGLCLGSCGIPRGGGRFLMSEVPLHTPHAERDSLHQGGQVTASLDAHQKHPLSLGPPYGPRQSPTLGSCGGAVFMSEVPLYPAPLRLNAKTCARAGDTDAVLWDHDPARVHPTPYTLHPTPFTLHPSPYTLHPTPFTLHPAPHTLHPAHYTPMFAVALNLHPEPETRTPTPPILHPDPRTRNSTPEALKNAPEHLNPEAQPRKHRLERTLHPAPETQIPKPETLNPKA